MAEFVQTMKDWRRMCELHTCDNRDENELPLCPLVIKHDGYPCDDAVTDLSQESVAQIEQIVTAWAAENPEPVYPAWEDWLLDIGVIRKWMSWSELNIPLRKPIPADIAQKLGIEPKEGKNHD